MISSPPSMLNGITIPNHCRKSRIETSAPAIMAAKMTIALMAPCNMLAPITSKPVIIQTIALTTSFDVPCCMRVDKVIVAPARSERESMTMSED